MTRAQRIAVARYERKKHPMVTCLVSAVRPFGMSVMEMMHERDVEAQMGLLSVVEADRIPDWNGPLNVVRSVPPLRDWHVFLPTTATPCS